MDVSLEILKLSYGVVLRVTVETENDGGRAEISLSELRDALAALPE